MKNGLSSQVQEHLDTAMAELRNALWHASRNEKPAILSQIAELIHACEKVSTVSSILEHLDDMKSNNKNLWSDHD